MNKCKNNEKEKNSQKDGKIVKKMEKFEKFAKWQEEMKIFPINMIWRMENVNKCKNNGKEKNIKKDGKIENIAKWQEEMKIFPKDGTVKQKVISQIKLNYPTNKNSTQFMCSMWFQSHNKKYSHKTQWKKN